MTNDNSITLDQLQVLHCIIQTGSFRAAAQKLNRAQSAVSYAVRTLEEHLEFKIFDRSKYRPELTTSGRFFASKAEEVINQFAQLNSSARFLKLGHEPVIRIAVSGLWPMQKLAKVLQDFRKKFPHTNIKLFQDVLSADQVLLAGEVDLVFSEIFNDTQALAAHELFAVNMIPLCSPAFPLAKCKGQAQIEDLRKNTQIVLRSTSSKSVRSSQIFNPANTISVGDFLSKKELMLAGVGWGFMPEHLVKEELGQKKFVYTHTERMKIPMSIAYNPNHAQGPCAEFLWEAFTTKQIQRRREQR